MLFITKQNPSVLSLPGVVDFRATCHNVLHSFDAIFLLISKKNYASPSARFNLQKVEKFDFKV